MQQREALQSQWDNVSGSGGGAPEDSGVFLGGEDGGGGVAGSDVDNNFRVVKYSEAEAFFR